MTQSPADDFIASAVVPRDAAHISGDLSRAEEIRCRHPEVATASIHGCAVLADEEGVRRFLAADPGSATAKGGPYAWDALTHLCFSRYLRLDATRSEAFEQTAAALLDAGADADGGWMETGHEPTPVWESVLYGAAGVAHHAGLTRLLLARGADPNDDEVPYHAPESRDNAVLDALVESGRLSADSFTTILIRKIDWHDTEAIRWLLARGVDPNRPSRWGATAIHFAIRDDVDLETVIALLDHGADPSVAFEGSTAVAQAAWRGRRDLLELFESRGIPIALRGLDALVAACARDDEGAIAALLARDPGLAHALRVEGGTLLAHFAATSNVPGIARLLALGVPVDQRFHAGSGYHGIAAHSTALHVAAWKAWHGAVQYLIGRGADVHARDGEGRTPLRLASLAVRDAWWTHRRSTESVKALLAAGASAEGMPFPTGHHEVDECLRRTGMVG